MWKSNVKRERERVREREEEERGCERRGKKENKV